MVEALRAGGAERVSVGDWHMVGTNVQRERMPAGVEVRPIADLALPGRALVHEGPGGGALDAVVLIGHHAKTSSPHGFSSHTFVWDMDVQLGGGRSARCRSTRRALAAEGIPILVAAGDRWLLDELDDGELGSARLVAAKEGQGRASARSYDPPPSAPSWRARSARRSPPRCSRHPPAATRRSCASPSSARRSPARPWPHPADLLATIAEIFRSSQVSREYRQLAKLFPAGQGSRLRSARRRLGAALATPVMLSKERRWLASSGG